MEIPYGGTAFENPETGTFIGTIIDVVDLGKKLNKFNEEKVRVRICWVLDKNDSQGKPFRAKWDVNSLMADGSKNTKKSNMYVIAESVLGGQPPKPFDAEILIGRSNQLVIVREGEYANIKAILPLPGGVVPPQAPTGFVRAKDKVAQAVANTVGSTPTSQPTVPGVVQATPQPVAVGPDVVF